VGGYLLDGLSVGCLYAFIALGYTMVYGIIKLINFAHGEIFMVGAFLALLSLRSFGVERLPLPGPLPVLLAWLFAAAFAALGCAVLSVVIERLCYRPLRGRGGKIAALLAALGVSLFLQYLVAQPRLAGSSQQSFPEPRVYTRFEDADPLVDPPGDAYVTGVSATLGGVGADHRVYIARETDLAHDEGALASAGAAYGADGYYEELDLTVGARKLLIVVALVISTGALYFLVVHTKQGKAMRAVSYDMATARLMGIDVDRTISFTFFLGACLAGIGGLLWALRYGKVEPYMGSLPGLKAFIAAVLGAIGSIPGAVMGGILLGVLESLATVFLPEGYTSYRDAVAFVVLILILLVRPQGLFGRFEGEKV